MGEGEEGCRSVGEEEEEEEEGCCGVREGMERCNEEEWDRQHGVGWGEGEEVEGCGIVGEEEVEGCDAREEKGCCNEGEGGLVEEEERQSDM